MLCVGALCGYVIVYCCAMMCYCVFSRVVLCCVLLRMMCVVMLYCVVSCGIVMCHVVACRADVRYCASCVGVV